MLRIPQHVQEEDAEALKQLAVRMGQEKCQHRLDLEAHLREQQGHEQERGFFRLNRKMNLYRFIQICLKASGLWSRAHRNYFDVRVTENEVCLRRLPREFDGFRILQLTDLHADLHPDFPDAVRRAVDAVEADIVVVTGDFRTCTYGDHSGATAASLEILSHVDVPIYATLGNHDFLAKVPPMERAGIRFLMNEHVLLERSGARLALIGIDDPNFYHSDDLERALEGMPAGLCQVLLSHAPSTHIEAAAAGIDFVLSGHTHGGQLCLPGGRVLVHDGTAPRKVLAGRWTEGELQGYTSRGTGASGLPVRLNCPSEVCLHTLRCPD